MTESKSLSKLRRQMSGRAYPNWWSWDLNGLRLEYQDQPPVYLTAGNLIYHIERHSLHAVAEVLGLAAQLLYPLFMPNQVGHIICMRRRQLNMTVSQLACMTGSQTAYIEALQQGQCAQVQWETLRRALQWPDDEYDQILVITDGASIHSSIDTPGLMLQMGLRGDNCDLRISVGNPSVEVECRSGVQPHQVILLLRQLREAQDINASPASLQQLAVGSSMAVRWVVAGNVGCPSIILSSMAHSLDCTQPVLRRLMINPRLPDATRSWLGLLGMQPMY